MSPVKMQEGIAKKSKKFSEKMIDFLTALLDNLHVCNTTVKAFMYNSLAVIFNE